MTSDLKTYGEEAIANMFIYVRKQKMLNFVDLGNIHGKSLFDIQILENVGFCGFGKYLWEIST